MVLAKRYHHFLASITLLSLASAFTLRSEQNENLPDVVEELLNLLTVSYFSLNSSTKIKVLISSFLFDKNCVDTEHMVELIDVFAQVNNSPAPSENVEPLRPGYPTENSVWRGPGNVGQIVGIAVDPEGKPVIFHRGDRTWNYEYAYIIKFIKIILYKNFES